MDKAVTLVVWSFLGLLETYLEEEWMYSQHDHLYLEPSDRTDPGWLNIAVHLIAIRLQRLLIIANGLKHPSKAGKTTQARISTDGCATSPLCMQPLYSSVRHAFIPIKESISDIFCWSFSGLLLSISLVLLGGAGG